MVQNGWNIKLTIHIHGLLWLSYLHLNIRLYDMHLCTCKCETRLVTTESHVNEHTLLITNGSSQEKVSSSGYKA